MNRNMQYIVIALVALVGFGAIYYGKMSGSSEPVEAIAAQSESTPSESTEAAANAESAEVQEMTLGDVNAPVKVIEYSSYTCPHCAAFHVESFGKLKADYIDTGKVHFTYREVYFDRIGLWASMIARCGGEEKFFGISDLILKGQRDWLGDGDPVKIADGLRKLARVAGLGAEEIDACLEDEATAKSLVAWFQANSEEHGIQSTPSFIVDGKLIAGNNYATVKAAIDAELGE